jgi:hypothetical protein
MDLVANGVTDPVRLRKLTAARLRQIILGRYRRTSYPCPRRMLRACQLVTHSRSLEGAWKRRVIDQERPSPRNLPSAAQAQDLLES